MFDKLEDLIHHYEELMNLLSEPDVANDANRFKKLMKEQSDLAPIVETYKKYKECKQNIEDSLAILDEESDEEMRELAKEELKDSKEQVEELSSAILDAKQNVRYCKECFTLTDEEICPICSDSSRNHKVIMVVENTRDLAAYEKTQKYDGVYHVLHGAISPMLGIGPGDIKLKELMQRLQKDVDEVIIATNSSLEGETTAMYISKLIKPTGIKVTRIASGVPVGGDLEYIDEVTLLRALEGRTEL